MDSRTNIQELKDKIQKFCEDREWDQFHSAKDLAIGVSTEASELLEHFRFKSEKEVEEMLSNPDKKAKIGEEMADVMIFLTRLAQKYNFNLAESFDKKLAKSGSQYPVDLVKGSNKKYTEYA